MLTLRRFFILSALFSTALPVAAGTYAQTAIRVENGSMPPFAIVHPPGYDGTNSTLTVRVCSDTDHPELLAPTQRAIDLWSALVPTVGNCDGCVLWEETAPEEGSYNAITTILHEMGHCAMGLGHINLLETDFDVDSNGFIEPTSFTASVEATEVFNPNALRGDFDDDHVNQCPFGNPFLGGCPDPPPPLPIQVLEIHWYRTFDNDPFTTDGLPVAIAARPE